MSHAILTKEIPLINPGGKIHILYHVYKYEGLSNEPFGDGRVFADLEDAVKEYNFLMTTIKE